MRSRLLTPIATVAAVIVLLLFASHLRGTFAPAVPADIFHGSVINDASCTTCHTPGRQAPLKLTHAPGIDCLNCHQKRNRE